MIRKQICRWGLIFGLFVWGWQPDVFSVEKHEDSTKREVKDAKGCRSYPTGNGIYVGNGRAAHTDGGYASLQFSADGTRFLADTGEKIWVAETNTGKLLAGVSRDFDWHNYSRPQLSPDGSKVHAKRGGKLEITEVATGKVLAIPQEQSKTAIAQFSPDGSKIFSIAEDNSAKIIDANTGKLTMAFPSGGPASSFGMSAINISPDSSTVLFISGERNARIADLKTGKILSALEHSNYFPVQFSPNSARIVLTEQNATLLVDPKTGKTIWTILDGDKGYAEAQFSPDGSRIVTTNGRNTSLAEAESGRIIAEFPNAVHSDAFPSQFSPDSSKF